MGNYYAGSVFLNISAILANFEGSKIEKKYYLNFIVFFFQESITTLIFDR